MSIEVGEGLEEALELPRKKEDLLVKDMGGGIKAAITKQILSILQRTNHQTAMVGYQEKGSPQIFEVVNTIIKAFIKGRDMPVLFLINYATLSNNEEERE